MTAPHLRRCETCRWWSERIARASRGVLEALCLRDYGHNAGSYTRARQSCAGYERGTPKDQGTAR